MRARGGLFGLTAAGVIALAAVALSVRGEDARYSSLLACNKDRFSRVLALGYTDLGTNGRGRTEVRTVGGQACLVGSTVGFDVDDRYAFDIDEPVDLTLTYVPELTTAQSIVVLFDSTRRSRPTAACGSLCGHSEATRISSSRPSHTVRRSMWWSATSPRGKRRRSRSW